MTYKQKVELIYNNMFLKYISPYEYDRLSKNWILEDLPNNGTKIINRIKSLLKSGHIVKSGYMATSIYNGHKFFIYYNKPINQKVIR